MRFTSLAVARARFDPAILLLLVFSEAQACSLTSLYMLTLAPVVRAHSVNLSKGPFTRYRFTTFDYIARVTRTFVVEMKPSNQIGELSDIRQHVEHGCAPY